jgi:transcriptional regulator with XRE-family HTH domain
MPTRDTVIPLGNNEGMAQVPKTNPTRALNVEETLAQRIAFERQRRGWTYDGLAKRMTDLGCPIQASGLYKIENPDPQTGRRRRITVDELAGLSHAFGIRIPDLLEHADAADDARFLVLMSMAESTHHDIAVLRLAHRDQMDELVQLCTAPDVGAARVEQVRRRLTDWEAQLHESDDTDFLQREFLTALLDRIEEADRG